MQIPACLHACQDVQFKTFAVQTVSSFSSHGQLDMDETRLTNRLSVCTLLNVMVRKA